MFTILGERKVAAALLRRPGLDRDTIIARLSSTGFEPPDDLVDLYEFCDGIEQNHPVSNTREIFYYFTILPLEDALAEFGELQSLGFENIQPGWFPVLGGLGDWYCIDLAAGESFGRIYEYDPETGTYETFESLYRMLKTIVLLYEQETGDLPEGRALCPDALTEAIIARQENPTIPYWQERCQER